MFRGILMNWPFRDCAIENTVRTTHPVGQEVKSDSINQVTMAWVS